MNNKYFCHLHQHSTYSLLDGLGTAEQYAKKAKEMGFEYLCINDHGNIDGVIKQQKACDKYELKPIFAMEGYLVPDASKKEKGEKRGHINLLVKNKVGFENLCLLLNKANMDGFYYRPRIDYDNLYDHCEGLVIMSACVGSFLNLPGGEDFFFDLDEKIRGDLYLEVMPHPHEIQYKMNQLCLDIHNEFPDIKLVATIDGHYLEKDDAVCQDVLLAINSKKTWNDPERFKFDFRDLYFASANEILDQFSKQDILNKKQYTAAMMNTIEVAKKCSNYRIERKPIKLPVVMENGDQFLADMCEDRLEELFPKGVPQEYYDRFDREFDLLKRKDFIDYFLIVHELIEWCRNNDIMTGPRGSVCGSLTAFLLRITCVDPLKFNLLFERFLDDERESYPDVDTDFPDIKRGEVRLHLMDMYGKNNIAGVSTFLTMKSKGCVRDVSRVFEVPLKEVNAFCDIIGDGNVEEAIALDKTFSSKNPKELEIITRLEGNIRGAGKNASAVVVAPYDLTKSKNSVLVKRKGEMVVNWDKDDSEYMGLMKLDVLGLNTLTVLSETKKLIKQNKNIDIIFEEIPLEDKKVLKSLNGENVGGLFQLSGFLARQVTKDLGVDSFNDVVAIMALGRPGPFDSGMAQEYVLRKKGKQWDKMHPLYEEVLKNTFGLVVFQEDIMMIINKVAGLSFSIADQIRKIIGKKRDVEEFKPYEKMFIEGCLEQKTLNQREAENIWEAFLKFALYGFNKSHAVAYGMIAMWGAYLKYHYPVEFICANLTYGKEDKKVDLITEARKLGLEVVLPKINSSHPTKWVAKDNKLFVPFAEIKGIGEKSAVKIATLKRELKQVNEGFFSDKVPGLTSGKEAKKSKLEKIADDIGAWGELCPVTAKAQEYFSFKISDKPEVLYPNLCYAIDDIFPCDIDDVLTGKVGYPHLIGEESFLNPEVKQCNLCGLRGCCKAPILPTKGKYNLAIINGTPSFNDDRTGESLSGDGGEVLWTALKKKGIKKSWFHITNVCKCYPKKEKVTKAFIKTCSDKWLMEEINEIDCRIILALGKIPVELMGEKDDGIMKLNGTTTWNDAFQAWICWCINPASVLMDPENKTKFNQGINNFSKMLKIFDLK